METYLPIYRVALIREREEPYSSIVSYVDAAKIAQQYCDGVDREICAVLLLDTKNNVIGINTVAMGSLNQATVHPREVFKPAILANAAGIIIVHNHPSGDPIPSAEDVATTERLVQAGEIIGIQLVDSIIIGYKTYYSMKAHELI